MSNHPFPSLWRWNADSCSWAALRWANPYLLQKAPACIMRPLRDRSPQRDSLCQFLETGLPVRRLSQPMRKRNPWTDLAGGSSWTVLSTAQFARNNLAAKCSQIASRKAVWKLAYIGSRENPVSKSFPNQTCLKKNLVWGICFSGKNKANYI